MTLYKLFLLLFSRRSYWGFWMALRKLSSHGLNMGSPAKLPCHETGEQFALAHVISCAEAERIVVFDVGAHVGDYTHMCRTALARANRPHAIYTFEPAQAAFRSLLHRFPDDQSIHLENVGISSETGEKSLYMLWDWYAGASTREDAVQRTESQGEVISERAQFTTIDDYARQHNIESITLLKIDVEGMEALALEGAREFIDAGKVQFIQFEISQATMLHRSYLYDFWKRLSANFRFFLIMNQGLVEIAEYSPHLENFANATNYLLQRRAAGGRR